MRVKRPSEKLLRVRSCSSHSDVCTSGHLVGKGLPRAEKGEATVRDTSKRSSQLRRRRFSCAPCGPLPHAPGRERAPTGLSCQAPLYHSAVITNDTNKQNKTKKHTHLLHREGHAYPVLLQQHLPSPRGRVCVSLSLSPPLFDVLAMCQKARRGSDPSASRRDVCNVWRRVSACGGDGRPGLRIAPRVTTEFFHEEPAGPLHGLIGR